MKSVEIIAYFYSECFRSNLDPFNFYILMTMIHVVLLHDEDEHTKYISTPKLRREISIDRWSNNNVACMRTLNT